MVRILIIAGVLLYFPILYYVIIAAVEEGTIKALTQYEKIKDDKKQD